ncbi:MAG: PAS domain-containing protein, partial [Gemmataceae bacterium]
EELQTVNAEMSSKNDLLTNLNSDLKNLLDSTQIATIFLDSRLRIRNFTPGMMDIFHLRETDRGRPLTDIVSLLNYGDLERDVAHVLKDLAVVEREVALQDGGPVFIMRLRPYRSTENVIQGVVMTFVDITERKKADTAVRKSEVRFSAIVNQAAVGVAETDLAGRFVLTNARFCEIVGRSDEALKALRMQDITHPEDLPRNQVLFDRLVSAGTGFEIETRYVRPDGEAVWVQNSVSALLDDDGRPHRLLAVSLEIGERKGREAQAELLLGELDHRVKNILAIVISVVSQTLKTSSNPQTFAAAIKSRIEAISRAHSILTNRGGRESASLHSLIATELAPYNLDGRDIAVDGPEVRLTPKAGLSFGLTFHELASNAAKYGALSVSGGSLSLSWKIYNHDDRRLRLTWIETGGPTIQKAPATRGFGTTVIERTMQHDFDAAVTREFLPSGLRCTIEMPLTPEVGIVPAGPQGGEQK